jgi:hypothetical protein
LLIQFANCGLSNNDYYLALARFDMVMMSDTVAGQELRAMAVDKDYTISVQMKGEGDTFYDSKKDNMSLNTKETGEYYQDSKVQMDLGATIAHEGHHAYEDSTGTRAGGDEIIARGTREQNASAVENNYRAEMGLDQRTDYYLGEGMLNGQYGDIYIDAPQWDTSTDTWNLNGQSWELP